MRIIVIGAGTVGYSIAALLCEKGHGVTVIDCDEERVRQINNNLDVRGITGSGSQSSIIFQAEPAGTDLCLAVTGDDEVNIIGGSIAKAMGAQRSVARVYAPVFRDLSTFDYPRHFQVDRLLSLEHLSALEMAREIRHVGSIDVENLALGKLEVHEVTVAANKKSVGKNLIDLGISKGVRIGSMTRDGKTWIAGPYDEIQVGDLLTVIGKRTDVAKATKLFAAESSSTTTVVIAGGGETGYHLATVLEGRQFNVVVLDRDRKRCDYLASRLAHTTVINCEATQRSCLEEERVDNADVFAACTGEDENNIMAAVEAKDIGAKSAMALVSRPDYAQIVGKLGIDHVVSPREVIAKQVLGYLASGPVISTTQHGDGQFSIVELEVKAGVKATQKVLSKLELPPRTLIAARLREGFVEVPGAADQLKAGDTVVMLVANDVFDTAVGLFKD